MTSEPIRAEETIRADRVSVILPAAGRSRRMGRPKLLLPFDGRPAVDLLLETLEQAGLDRPILVLGPVPGPLAEHLARRPVVLARNPDPASEMTDSVRCGLTRLPPGSTGLLVWPADHVLVLPATVTRLLDAHRDDPEALLVPVFEGRGGHPVLLPRRSLADLSQTEVLRDLVRGDTRQRRLAVEDPAVRLDLDTPEDYRAALQLWRSRRDRT